MNESRRACVPASHMVRVFERNISHSDVRSDTSPDAQIESFAQFYRAKLVAMQYVAMLVQGCALFVLGAFMASPALASYGIAVWLYCVLSVLSLTLLLVYLYPTMKRLLGG